MKVLVITYYWPPAGGPGVQRWLKFVKYLPKYDIEPVVYIPENPTYPLCDISLQTEVSNDVVVLKHPIFEPYRLASFLSKKDSKTISSGVIPNQKKQTLLQRLLLYIRGNFFVPDARKFWVKPSVRYLKAYISENNIDTIITTGPPHSVHLIGMRLKAALNVQWFADFRDPWTTIGYHDKLKLGKRANKLHKALERRVLTIADHIIVTSFTTRKEFSEITRQPITVITNGYDIEEIPVATRDTNFTISHIGSLLSGRDPKNLWKAIATLRDENPAFSKVLKINLVGTVSDSVLESMKSFGLEKYVHLQGYVSHDKAIQLQHQAQLLLLIEIDSPETKCIVPGKLFEYLSARRPILAVGPEDADIATIIQETHSGKYFGYDDYALIKKQLAVYFKAFQENNLEVVGNGIEKYTRENLTARLAVLLKK